MLCIDWGRGNQVTLLDEQGRATRRAVLMGCGASALGFASVGAQARSSGLTSSAVASPDAAELRIWQDRIGMTFRLSGGEGSLRVAAVQPMPTEGARPDGIARRQNFLVIFEGASHHAPDGDDIYRMTNLFAGTVSLFLGQASDTAAGGKRFVAAFN